MAEEFLYKVLTYEVIGAAMEVHRELGPGFLEYVYEEALCYELRKREVPYERQVDLEIFYKDYCIPKRYRADLLIDETILVDNKAIRELTSANDAQLLNYLKATKMRVGLLLNFGTRSLQYRRMVL
jgi:GxxExxY protein